MAKMKIDGKEVEFNPGMTILDAAESANIYIPKLCFIKGLPPYGGCRLCLVKIKGSPRPIQTSCSTIAEEGMDVITNDEELNEMRRDIIQLILSEHPSGCLVCGNQSVCKEFNSFPDERPALRVFGCFACASKETCDLKKIVDYLGIKDLEFPIKYKHIKPNKDDLFFETDYNLCIACGKCVRVCSEVMGYNAISLVERSGHLAVAHPEKVSRNMSDCQFCGGCVDICPVGVYSTKKPHWYTHPDEFKASVCNFCSVGCEFNYQINEGKLIDACHDVENLANKGSSCIYGRFCSPEFHQNDARIKDIVIRSGGKETSSTFEKAVGHVAEALKKYKPEEIGILLSPDLSNESAFMFKKFAEAMGIENIGVITGKNIVENFEIMASIPRSFEALPGAKVIHVIDANLQLNHQGLVSLLKKAKDNGAIINYYSCCKQEVFPNVKCLFTEEKYLTPAELEKIIAGIKTSNDVFLIGTPSTSGIFNQAIKLALNNNKVSVIPLRNRANFEGVFSVIPKSEKEIMDKLNAGSIKAMYLTERIDIDIAKKAEFVVIQDIFQSEISKIANVVLPTLAFLEDSGSITNAEFRTQFKIGVANPISKLSVADWKYVCEIAKIMKPTAKNEFEVKNSGDIKVEYAIEKNELKNPKDVKLEASENKLEVGDSVISPTEFRGQKIFEVVSDLMKLIEIRSSREASPVKGKADKKKGTQSAKGTIAKDSEDAVDKEEVNYWNFELNDSGEVQFGEQKFGVKALNGMVQIASTANQKIKLLVDQDQPNFLMLNGEELCLCNFYRKNMQSSNYLFDFSQPPYKNNVYPVIKVKSGKKESLESIDNLVLVDLKFVTLSDSKFEQLKPALIDEDKKPDMGMQFRAMRILRNLLKKQKLFQKYSSKDQAENAIPLNWKVIGAKSSKDQKPVKATKITLLNPKEGKVVQADPKKCMGCGHCAEICPHKAITMITKTEKKGPFEKVEVRYSSIDPNICYRCSYCVKECPVCAISIHNLDLQ